MKILYGVQATGQGHISRARSLAESLKALPVDVTWLFSGRSREDLFDMEIFGEFEHRTGLTFATHAGRVRYRRTVWNAQLLTFLRDIRDLDLHDIDLIVTDYEPITAWAGKLARREVIGIGHQYAFGANTPTAGANPLQRLVMQLFAPVSRPVGLHWAPFAKHVMPPILDLPRLDNIRIGEHFLVYLPFEDQALVTRWLQQWKAIRFVQYANGILNEDCGNVTRRAASIAGFKRDLATARGVICNTGFELISECLQWQKPVLTRPLKGQMEQLSNGAALEQLGYATVMHSLDDRVTTEWLSSPPVAPTVHFGAVSTRLAHWLAGGATTAISELSSALWRSDEGRPAVRARTPARGQLLRAPHR